MTLQKMQQEVDEWIESIGVRYFGEMTQLGILMEEVGEVARIMSRTYGEQSFKEDEGGRDLGEELADVLFTVFCIANKTGINLQEKFSANMDEKARRDINRHRDNVKLSPDG